MEKIYDLLVIGWGKAGKTLSAKIGAKGKKVATSSTTRIFVLFISFPPYYLISTSSFTRPSGRVSKM